MNIRHKYLFEPLRVRGAMLKNRIIAAPMGVPKAITPSSTNYGGISLSDKALGGAAVITVGDSGIANIAQEKDPFTKYARDVTREVISICRQGGGLAQLEIPFHGAVNEDGTIQGPSDGRHFTGGRMREMTRAEMQQTIDRVSSEAKNAKEFGFDMVMLHFGHDSLCSVFLSPVWNKRTDEYGGSVENRTRFAREAVRAIRKSVGKDFPLLMRVSRNLMVEESFTEDDMLYFIKSVQEEIDIVNVSCGMDCYGGSIENYTANTYTHTSIFLPRMYSLDFCERVKSETKLLVCIVGGVSDPEDADKAIAQGKIDAVMLGRQLVADPFWPKKAEAGLDDEIVPCLRCSNCYHIATEHANVQCSVNPRFRRENRVPLKLEKADHPRKVVVIGGGPAGMVAAITARERGHDVILLEKSEQLGGNLKYADYGDYKTDIRKYRDYLIRHIRNSGAEVRLNTEATKESVTACNPDALIVAVGAEFVTPKIPGIEYAAPAVSVLADIDKVRGKICIIGGGAIGSEIAMEFANRGNEVIVIEALDALAKKSNWLYRHGLYNAIKDSQTPPSIALSTKVKEILSGTELIAIRPDGNEEHIFADKILYCVGMRSNKDLAYSFYGICPETSVVGDCRNVAQILEATNEAYFVAANL